MPLSPVSEDDFCNNLQRLFSSVAIGSAVMSDFTTAADRGGYITAVQASAMFAPALGPVLGGILTQFLGCRSGFWFLTIAAGVFLIIYVPFVPEVSCVAPLRVDVHLHME